MSGNEYVLRIEGFTPQTLPMARLAEYLSQLADLLGHKDSAHFLRVEEGSAQLVTRIEPHDAPKVQRRLMVAQTDDAPRDLVRAFTAIDQMLADDNTVGELIAPHAGVVIAFPGVTRPRPLTFPAFTQDGSVEGQIVRVGGADKTSHVILQNGAITYANISLDRVMARDLAQHLYGPTVRLIGRGRWERHPDGSWRLLAFAVDRYEVLDDAPLGEVLKDLRDIAPKAFRDNVYEELMNLRGGEDDVH